MVIIYSTSCCAKPEEGMSQCFGPQCHSLYRHCMNFSNCIFNVFLLCFFVGMHNLDKKKFYKNGSWNYYIYYFLEKKSVILQLLNFLFFVCSIKWRKSYRFWTAWGWVNNDTILIVWGKPSLLNVTTVSFWLCLDRFQSSFRRLAVPETTSSKTFS